MAQQNGRVPSRRESPSRLGRARSRGLDSHRGRAGCCGPHWAQGGDPISMGIATDMTGAIAPSGNSNWQVAQFAVQGINDAGGILGRPVELLLEDTASDPGVAVGNVRRLHRRRRST